MKQEGRHIDFYASQAHARLEGSTAAQHMTRTALRRLWAPVGSGVMPKPEVRHLITYLFGDEPGQEAVARIDRRIDQLPGMDGMRREVTQPTIGVSTYDRCTGASTNGPDFGMCSRPRIDMRV